MNLDEVLNYRRSVRVYDKEKEIDTERVKHCLELATLAPNSSDMQLWEFYHITQPELMAKVSRACLDQKATSTASQIVVFVTRRDLYRKRAKFVLDFETGNIRRNSPIDRQEKRIKDRKLYYGILMPFVYARFCGILGLFRVLLANIISIFRPMMLEVSEGDVRVVVHKSCALAAQTFMIAMANEGYDTCPLEGLNSRRLKRLLKLPHGAEINMVVSCGIRNGNKGIWGERYRLRKFIVRFDGTDAVVKTPKYIYVFEFKLNGTAEQALQQIDEKGYLIPYQTDGREVVKVGEEFSAEKRNIGRWLL